MTIDYNRMIGEWDGDKFVEVPYYKFRPGQEVWWLDNYSWTVKPVVIVEFAFEGWGKRWNVKAKNGNILLADDDWLFLEKSDAYKKGVEKLTREANSYIRSLNDATRKRQNLIREARGEGLPIE